MSSACDWFPAQTFEPKRYQPGNKGSWSGHLPFAHDLVVALRPSLFVELGTHLGESYFGFCQAIAENRIPCSAYAIDNWIGDEHAGFYDESVYSEVCEYNEANYRSFSSLLRTRFDDALEKFSNDSIDILHLDGLHTFEAVSHDFYSWLPKVKPGGVVLLHDIIVRDRDFGVWKLWTQLKEQGLNFEFHHSFGLGVFQKPGETVVNSRALRALFDCDERTCEHLRHYYSLAAIELEWKHAFKRADPQSRIQVFLPRPEGYLESASTNAWVKPGAWQRVVLDLPEGFGTGLPRLDPSDQPSIIDIRGVAISSSVDRTVLWEARGITDLENFTLGGTLFDLHSTQANGARSFFSYGNDPQLYFPPLDFERFDQPLTLTVWIRIRTDFGGLLPFIQSPGQTPSSLEHDGAGVISHSDALKQQKPALADQLQAFSERLNTAQAEQERLLSENKALIAERETLLAEQAKLNAERTNFAQERNHLIQEINKRQTKIYLLEDLPNALNRAEARTADLEENHKKLVASYEELSKSHRALLEGHDHTKATLDGVLRSHSWKLTAPLRKVTESWRHK